MLAFYIFVAAAIVIGGLVSLRNQHLASYSTSDLANWQGVLPILPFRGLLIPAESRHSGIDTRMFHGIHRNRMPPESVYWNGI